MTEWKIEESLQELSPAEKKVFLQGLLKLERDEKKLCNKSIALKMGLGTIVLGGVATSIWGSTFFHDHSGLCLLLITGGGLFSLGGIMYPGLTDGTEPEFYEKGILDYIDQSKLATQSIKYLKNKIKELNGENEIV